MTTFNNKMMPPMGDNYRLVENYYPPYNYAHMPQPPLPLHHASPFVNQTFSQMSSFNPPAQPSHHNDANNFLRNRGVFHAAPQQAFHHDNKQLDDVLHFPKPSIPTPSNLQPLVPTRTKKKIGKPVPEEKKDKSYWEKRNKNNTSAKRSRETRRNRSRLVADEIVVKTNQLEMLKRKLLVVMEEERRLRMMYTERGLQCPY